MAPKRKQKSKTTAAASDLADWETLEALSVNAVNESVKTVKWMPNYVPPARAYHSTSHCVLPGSQQLILFGGEVFDHSIKRTKYFNDLFRVKLARSDAPAVCELAQSAEKDVFPATSAHHAVSLSASTVLFTGGETHGKYTSECWLFNAFDDTITTSSRAPWGPRAAHRVVPVDVAVPWRSASSALSPVVLFGGFCTTKSGDVHYLSDVWLGFEAAPDSAGSSSRAGCRLEWCEARHVGKGPSARSSCFMTSIPGLGFAVAGGTQEKPPSPQVYVGTLQCSIDKRNGKRIVTVSWTVVDAGGVPPNMRLTGVAHSTGGVGFGGLLNQPRKSNRSRKRDASEVAILSSLHYTGMSPSKEPQFVWSPVLPGPSPAQPRHGASACLLSAPAACLFGTSGTSSSETIVSVSGGLVGLDDLQAPIFDLHIGVVQPLAADIRWISLVEVSEPLHFAPEASSSDDSSGSDAPALIGAASAPSAHPFYDSDDEIPFEEGVPAAGDILDPDHRLRGVPIGVIQTVNSWHFPMMRDEPRNTAYEKLLCDAISAHQLSDGTRPRPLVIDLGAGAGMLVALAAKYAGAIVAVEGRPEICNCLQEVAASLSAQHKLTVHTVSSMSTVVSAADLLLDASDSTSSSPAKSAVANAAKDGIVLLHELFGVLLNGEMAVSFVSDFVERVLRPLVANGTVPWVEVVPARGVQFGVIVSSPSLAELTSAPSHLHQLNKFRDTVNVHFGKDWGVPVLSSLGDIAELSSPIALADVNFSCDTARGPSVFHEAVEFPVVSSGVGVAILYYWAAVGATDLAQPVKEVDECAAFIKSSAIDTAADSMEHNKARQIAWGQAWQLIEGRKTQKIGSNVGAAFVAGTSVSADLVWSRNASTFHVKLKV